MINSEELVICKRRGHDTGALGNGWAQCRWCGMWLRNRQVMEESEDEPPANDLDLREQFRKFGKGK